MIRRPSIWSLWSAKLCTASPSQDTKKAWNWPSVWPGRPFQINGDALRVRQVLLNLVGNALKFTPRGEVVVTVNMEPTDDQEPMLHFAVRDTGIGIASEVRDRLFNAFEQADSSTTRQFGGTGLGLAISRQIVALMGGEIWLESTPGVGSVFHFTFKFSEVPQNSSTPIDLAELEDLRGLPVLIIDDNASNRIILRKITERWHMLPSEAATGAEGLKQLEAASDSGVPYRLVLLDQEMPGMDGFEVIRRVRVESKLKDAAIMMLTSADQSATRAKCQALGVRACLLKPVKPSDLLLSIRKVLGKPRLEARAEARIEGQIDAQPSAPSNPGLPSAQALDILVAEDNPINQKLAVALLEKAGHRVSLAENGVEVIAKWREGRFDLILMDVQMPEMDGLEATRQIRHQEQSTGERIPIVATTAHAMTGDRERCLQAGMDDYVSKPLDRRELMAALSRLAQQRVLTPLAEVLNRAEVLERLGGDAELLGELIDIFLADSASLVQRVSDAVKNKDATALEAAAHKTKGTVSIFGSRGAVQAAQQLETMGKEGNLALAAEVFVQLKAHIEALEAP